MPQTNLTILQQNATTNSWSPKEEKEPSLTNLQNATSSYTTNHASQKKTQHTKSCNPKGRKEKFINFTTTNNAKSKGKEKTKKPTS
jgi:hypothetical protein